MQWYETKDGAAAIVTYSPAETWQKIVVSPYCLGRDEVKALRK